MSVYEKAHELARALRESQELRELKRIKNTVFTSSKNNEMITDFKRKQFELQTEQLAGKEPEKDKLDQLQQLYSILIANPDISKYFEAEYRFDRMVSDIYKILGESIGVDQELIK